MKNKIHPAWLMLIACCSLMFIAAFFSTVFSNFLKPVCDSLGFERTAFSMNNTIMGLVAVVSMTVVGRNLDRIGIRRFVSFGGIVLGLAFYAMSRSTEIWHFYACSVVVGIFATPISILTTSVVLNNWFVRSKGFAIGLAMSCSGLSAAIFSPIVVRFIENSWQSGFAFLGIMSVCFTLPVGLFLIRLHPSEIGAKAYGAGEAVDDEQVEWEGVPIRTARSQISFYTMFLAIFGFNFIAAGYSSHFAAHMGSAGMSAHQIGSFMSIMALALVFGKISSGFIYDRLGPIIMTVLVFGVGILTRIMIPATVAGGSTLFMVATALLGLSFAVGTVFPPLYASRLFGEMDYAKICPLFTVASSIGYAISNPLYGFYFDRTGSYDGLLYISAAATVLIILLIIFSIRSADKLRQPTAESLAANAAGN